MTSVLQAALIALAPAVVLFLAHRFKPVQWVGPVVVCYAVGIIARNIPGLPISSEVSGSVAELAVPIALPLLLVPTDMRLWVRAAGPTLLSFGFACFASFAAAMFFGTWGFADLPDAPKLTGMLTGVYIGGTANLTAVGMALNVDRETFVQLNAADVVAGGLYLLLMMTVAQRAARWLLPASASKPGAATEAESDVGATTSSDADRGPWPGFRQVAVGSCLGVGILLLSAAFTRLVFGKLETIPMLLALTVLGLAASLSPRLRTAPGAPFVGEYALYVFCISIGTMVDLRSLAAGSPTLLLLCFCVTLLAMALHLGLARVAKLDADTVIVTSTAAILGPAFIPAVANALGNRSLVASGVALGLGGFALGTWAGLAAAWLLGA